VDSKTFFKKVYQKLMHYYYSILSRLLCIFPVKNNTIIMWSYYYTKYSCNPRYITEYMLENDVENYKIYWVFEKKNIPFINDSRINIIKWKSLRYFYILCTSKFIITNSRVFNDSYFNKRKKQIYIQTWHSSMRLKKVEKDAINVLDKSYIEHAIRDSQMCDLIISGSRFSTETIKRAFWYKGDILEHGTPRNDILFKKTDKIKSSLFKFYNIDNENTKIIMYAPTFRKGNSLDAYNLDYLSLISTFEKKFACKCVLFLRMHPNLIKTGYKMENYNNVIIDVTNYHDIQHLLIASDFLITDYSSCMFDFALLNKPCFIYANDHETYDRGTYFRVEDLPFPFASTQEELEVNIDIFNNKIYLQNLFDFNENHIGSFERGNACKQIVEYIKYRSII
jgi:CDP-glycerol glycerophosphotransferase